MSPKQLCSNGPYRPSRNTDRPPSLPSPRGRDRLPPKRPGVPPLQSTSVTSAGAPAADTCDESLCANSAAVPDTVRPENPARGKSERSPR